MSQIIQSKLATYVRSFVFGVEDSLVSTAGLLSGVAVANVPKQTIILTGIVLIFVEAFSMAMGSFLSESSAEDYINKRHVGHRMSVRASGIMFFSYFISGFIPLVPYLLMPVVYAFWVSIFVSLTALFALGLVTGRITGMNAFRQGMRMLMIGGVALIVGVVVGMVV